MSENILWFKEIGIEDIPKVGGKGASLGEMVNNNFPVPGGFVITSTAYFNFIKGAGIGEEIISKIDAIDVENTDQLETVSKEIRQLIKRAQMLPEIKQEIINDYQQLNKEENNGVNTLVAVRSSATAEDLPSIHEDEFTLVKINKNTYFDKIKNIYQLIQKEANPKIEVIGMTNNNAKWLKAKSIYKHKAKKDVLFKIKTKTGREIIISPNHTLIALNENTLKSEETNIYKIKIGTKIPITSTIPLTNSNSTINVFETIQNEKKELFGNKIYIKNNSNNWKIQNPLPKEIKPTKEFAYFLGIYLAEGSTHKNNGISITNSKKEIIGETKKFLKQIKLNTTVKLNKNSLRFYCPSLVSFLHEICGKPNSLKKKGKLCYSKKIPNFVFSWDKELIGELLKGYFDGDGTVGKQISGTSVSKELISGISYLLQILKIEFYLREKRNAFDINIPFREAEEFKKLIGFISKDKMKKLEDGIKKHNNLKVHPEFKYSLQINNILSKTIYEKIRASLPKKRVKIAFCKCGKKAEQSSYYNQKRYYCKTCHKTFYEKDTNFKFLLNYKNFDARGYFVPGKRPHNFCSIKGQFSLSKLKMEAKKYGVEKLFSIFDGNIKWDEITSINEIKYDSWVYDFEVPKEENFLSGFGGIITHNSASFAGQQETYLNILGNTDVIRSVQDCWASLFTARAVYYRKKQGFDTKSVGLCAVVQKMVQSDVSGIMFTADPTGDETKIIIEAGFGLGETVVSGSITPDNYVIDKESEKLDKKKINHQEFMLVRENGKNTEIKLGDNKATMQKMTDEKVIELALIGKRIEKHYKRPMDIEWAMEKDRLYIVQARPITTLESGKKAEEKSKGEINATEKPILEGLPASPGIITGIVKVVPNIDDIIKVNSGDLLVTKMTSPSWVPVMKKASGIVTDEGGSTCHAAIVSRELGIPCVVGTSRGTIALKDGQVVTIDGTNGLVYDGEVKIILKEEKIEVLKDEEVDILEKKLVEESKSGTMEHDTFVKVEEIKKEFGKKKFSEMDGRLQEKEEEELISVLKDISTKVKVNVALPDAAEKAAATNAFGVGLLRAEHMITSSGMHPAEFIRQGKAVELKNVVKEGIRNVASRFEGPVWFRTFDARSDEFRELTGGEKELNEDNPMLGWHGIRRDLDSPEMFKAQLLAIKELRKEGLKNVGVMLPFVQSIEEIIQAKKLAAEVELQEEVDFGVMIETPASVWIIDEIIPYVKFVSFGTNDLTQLTLGLDRNNERVQKQFTELHPAILRELEYVITKCKKAGVITSICGQAASNPEMVRKLIWFGIDSVSANIDAVEKIRKVVMVEEKKRLLDYISQNPEQAQGIFHKLFNK